MIKISRCRLSWQAKLQINIIYLPKSIYIPLVNRQQMFGLGVLAGAADLSTGNPGLDFFYTLFNGISEAPLFRSHQWNSDTRSCDFGITNGWCNDGIVRTDRCRNGYHFWRSVWCAICLVL